MNGLRYALPEHIGPPLLALPFFEAGTELTLPAGRGVPST